MNSNVTGKPTCEAVMAAVAKMHTADERERLTALYGPHYLSGIAARRLAGQMAVGEVDADGKLIPKKHSSGRAAYDDSLPEDPYYSEERERSDHFSSHNSGEYND